VRRPRGVQVVPALAVASRPLARGEFPRPAGTANSRCAVNYWLAVHYWLVCRRTRLASPCRSADCSSGGGMATTGQVA
jgi:hypothetical protein